MTFRLAPADSRSAECWHRDREDREMRRFNPLATSSVEELQGRIAAAGSDLDDHERFENFFWVIEFEGAWAGQVSLQKINRMMATAEIGYGVSSAVRGKGLATRAVCSLSEMAFKQTPLRKLIAIVHENNASSRRVLEKAGFRLEGLLREHYLIEGEPANEALYGLLRSDLQVQVETSGESDS